MLLLGVSNYRNCSRTNYPRDYSDWISKWQGSVGIKSICSCAIDRSILEDGYISKYLGYIIDIKAENTNNCPEGYDPMINYVWPGTIDGCYCSSSANNYNFEFVLSVFNILSRANARVIWYLWDAKMWTQCLLKRWICGKEEFCCA